MNKEIILFYYPEKTFFISKLAEKILKKNYSRIILFNNSYKNKYLNYKYNKKKLNNIKNNYKKLGINLDIKKIYEINYFLQKIRFKNRNKNFFVSPYFISGIILEDEIIFYELSKIYKIQFIRPEISFIKNRFILAKNLFKQSYSLKTKTNFSKKSYDIFKINYITSIESFSAEKFNNKLSTYFSTILVNIFSFFLNFRFNNKPKKYALVILNNNKNLNSFSNIINLNYFINIFLTKFSFELVFLIHPRVNPLFFFLKKFRNEKFLFNNNRIIFLQKPKELINIIKNSEFIIHLSSSLSAQTLIFNKKILCLGKKVTYISEINNVISNLKKNNFNYLKKMINKNDIFKTDKFLINLLSNSIDSSGEFKLSTKTKSYTTNHLGLNKRNEIKIVHNLLNAI